LTDGRADRFHEMKFLSIALSCRFRAAGVGDHRGLTVSVGRGLTSSRDRGRRRAAQPQRYRKTVPDIRDLQYLDFPFDEPKLISSESEEPSHFGHEGAGRFWIPGSCGRNRDLMALWFAVIARHRAMTAGLQIVFLALFICAVMRDQQKHRIICNGNSIVCVLSETFGNCDVGIECGYFVGRPTRFKLELPPCFSLSSTMYMCSALLLK